MNDTKDKVEVVNVELVEEKETKTKEKKKTSTEIVAETSKDVSSNLEEFMKETGLDKTKAGFVLLTGTKLTNAAIQYVAEAQKELDKLNAQIDKNNKTVIDALQIRLNAANALFNTPDITIDLKMKFYDEIVEITTEIKTRLDMINKTIHEERVIPQQKKVNAGKVAAWTIGGVTVTTAVVIGLKALFNHFNNSHH